MRGISNRRMGQNPQNIKTHSQGNRREVWSS
nr:MAG TPA: hypothetical protein [Caudoviricetes sp.]